MKQADSSLLFPLLMKASERCVSPRIHLSIPSPFWKSLHIWRYKDILSRKSSHIWRYKDILSRKSSHKDISISVIFWTFLLGKLIDSVDLQGNTSSHQGLRQQQRK